MRIAFVTPEYATADAPDGGLANYVRNTAQELHKRGIEVGVVTLSNRAGRWIDQGVRIVEIPRLGERVRRVLWHLPAVWRMAPVAEQYVNAKRITRAFWRLHAEWPVDLVQASSYAAPGFELVHNGRVPVVCRASSYTALVRTAYGRVRTLSDHWTDWFEIRQVTGADASFAPSALVAGTYERLEGCKLKVIRTVAPGLGQESDQRFFGSSKPEGPYLLFFGTLSRIKGVDLIADVLGDILERHPQLGCVFIGRDDAMPGAGSCIDYIRKKAGRNAPRVRYIPPVSKPRLLPFVANALGVVMPSRVDNYPNACLEAQSLGIPVVGTTASSLDEMIQDGVTGFLARNGDSDDLRRAIERLLSMSQAERADMKSAILEHASKQRESDPVRELVAFYEEVVAGYRGSQQSARSDRT